MEKVSFSRVVFSILIILICFYGLNFVWTEEVNLKKTVENIFSKFFGWIGINKPTISVYPKNIVFEKMDYEQSKIFEIKNHSGKNKYAIDLKIWSKNEKFNYEKLQIFTPNLNDLATGKNKQGSVNYAIVRNDGIDGNNFPATHLFIYMIGSQTSLSFRISYSEQKEKINLCFKIFNFADEAPPIISSEERTAVQYVVSENFTFKRLHLRLKPNM